MSCLTQYEHDIRPASVEEIDADLHDLMPADLIHSAEDLMNICIWQTNEEAVFTNLSSTCIQVFKTHPAILVGRNLLDCLSDDEWANERDDMEAMFDGRYTFRSMSITFEVFPGRPLTLFVSGVPTFHPETGVFTGYRGIARCADLHCTTPQPDETDTATAASLLELLAEVAEHEMNGSTTSQSMSDTVSERTQETGTFAQFLERLGLKRCGKTGNRLLALRDLSVAVNCNNYCSESVKLMTNPEVFETAIKELCAESSSEKIPVIMLEQNTVSDSTLRVEIDRCCNHNNHNFGVESDDLSQRSGSENRDVFRFGPYMAAAMFDSLGFTLSRTILSTCRVNYTIKIPFHCIIREMD